MEKGESILKREQCSGKVLIQTEQQFAQQAVLARSTAVNGIKAQKLFFDNELDQAEQSFETLVKSLDTFEESAIVTIAGASAEKKMFRNALKTKVHGLSFTFELQYT
jgi:hypothetical protein